MLFIKTGYIVLGYLSLALGLTGIVLPGLPTTPFLLLTVWLFMKGSPKLHEWMLSHRQFGPILREIRTGKGISPQIKVGTAFITIASVTLTSIFILDAWWMRIVSIGLMLPSLYVLIFIVPTRKKALLPEQSDGKQASKDD